MKRYVKLIASTILGLSASQSFGLGIDVTLNDIYKYHPSSIDTIITCGNWKEMPDFGKYRITHAYLYGQSFLYVTKIEIDKTIATYKSKGNLSISEFNNDHAEVTLSSLECADTQTGVEITATGSYAHEDLIRKITISIFNEKFSYVLNTSNNF